MFLIVLVIDNPYFCNDLLRAWKESGVPGATIIESRGLGRALTLKGARDDLPILPTLDDLESRGEQRHRTIFSVVEEQETIERIKEVSQKIIGPFENDHTGFFFVVPVSEALGLRRKGDAA